MGKMIRTQVYIPQTLLDQVKHEARRQQTTVADLTRQFIEIGLQQVITRQPNTTLDDIIGLELSGGPSDLSEKLSEYIYGDATHE